MRRGFRALFVSACLFVVECGATDLAREIGYADRIADTLDFGEIVWLEAGGRKFLALYAETEYSDGKNAAIVLHDKGAHPDQKPLIHSLRTVLPAHRLSTLALQLPLRESGAGSEDYYALFPDAAARMRAAINFLTRKEYENIVIVGQGLGALMALQAQDRLHDGIKALALIGLQVPDSTHEAARTLEFIKKSEMPVLDLYSGQDVFEVAGTAGKRRLAAKANAQYRQVRLDGDDAMTVKRVYSWLRVVLAQWETEGDDEETVEGGVRD